MLRIFPEYFRKDSMMPTIYVDRKGVASLFKPAPISRMGTSASIIAGFEIRGFIPLELEPWIRELLWTSSPQRYQQPQLTYKGTN